MTSLKFSNKFAEQVLRTFLNDQFGKYLTQKIDVNHFLFDLYDGHAELTNQRLNANTLNKHLVNAGIFGVTVKEGFLSNIRLKFSTKSLKLLSVEINGLKLVLNLNGRCVSSVKSSSAAPMHSSSLEKSVSFFKEVMDGVSITQYYLNHPSSLVESMFSEIQFKISDSIFRLTHEDFDFYFDIKTDSIEFGYEIFSTDQSSNIIFSNIHLIFNDKSRECEIACIKGRHSLTYSRDNIDVRCRLLFIAIRLKQLSSILEFFESTFHPSDKSESLVDSNVFTSASENLNQGDHQIENFSFRLRFSKAIIDLSYDGDNSTMSKLETSVFRTSHFQMIFEYVTFLMLSKEFSLANYEFHMRVSNVSLIHITCSDVYEVLSSRNAPDSSAIRLETNCDSVNEPEINLIFSGLELRIKPKYMNEFTKLFNGLNSESAVKSSTHSGIKFSVIGNFVIKIPDYFLDIDITNLQGDVNTMNLNLHYEQLRLSVTRPKSNTEFCVIISTASQIRIIFNSTKCSGKCFKNHFSKCRVSFPDIEFIRPCSSEELVELSKLRACYDVVTCAEFATFEAYFSTFTQLNELFALDGESTFNLGFTISLVIQAQKVKLKFPLYIFETSDLFLHIAGSDKISFGSMVNTLKGFKIDESGKRIEFLKPIGTFSSKQVQSAFYFDNNNSNILTLSLSETCANFVESVISDLISYFSDDTQNSFAGDNDETSMHTTKLSLYVLIENCALLYEQRNGKLRGKIALGKLNFASNVFSHPNSSSVFFSADQVILLVSPHSHHPLIPVCKSRSTEVLLTLNKKSSPKFDLNVLACSINIRTCVDSALLLIDLLSSMCCNSTADPNAPNNAIVSAKTVSPAVVCNLHDAQTDLAKVCTSKHSVPFVSPSSDVESFYLITSGPGIGFQKKPSNGSCDFIIYNANCSVISNYFKVPPSSENDCLKKYSKPSFDYRIQNLNLSWSIFDGFDFNKAMIEPHFVTHKADEASGYSRKQSTCVEIVFTNVQLRYSIWRDSVVANEPASYFIVLVKDLVIFDRLKISTFNKLLSYWESNEHPRITNGSMISLKVLHTYNSDINFNDLESVVHISCQPLIFNIDQDTLDFLENFISRLNNGLVQSNSSASNIPLEESKSELTNALVYIRHILFSPEVPIRLNYQGKANFTKKSSGSNHTVMNIMAAVARLSKADLKLNRFSYRKGIVGYQKLNEFLLSQWGSSIKVPSILCGIQPLSFLRQLAKGLCDLIKCPYESWHKDRKICYGTRKGVYSFSSSTFLATLEIFNSFLHCLHYSMVVFANQCHISRKSSPLLNHHPPASLVDGIKSGADTFNNSMRNVAKDIKLKTAFAQEQVGVWRAVRTVARDLPTHMIAPFEGGLVGLAQVTQGAINQLDPISVEEKKNTWKTVNS